MPASDSLPELPASADTADLTEPEEVSSFLYADPGLTNSAQVSTERVLMIGDSVMLDASPQIKEKFPDCYIDAAQSRQLSDSIPVAEKLMEDGHLFHTVVISLGTNGEISESYCRELLDLFGPDISIFWVNVFGRSLSWVRDNNLILLHLQDEYSNMTVIDWNYLIKDHPEWLWEDEVHPNLEGSEVYAALIKESLDAAASHQIS